MNKKERDKCRAAYLKHRELIFEHCDRFIRRHKADPEDVVSQAHEEFMFIFHTHQPERGTLKNDISFRLPKRLLEAYHQNLNRRRLFEAHGKRVLGHSLVGEDGSVATEDVPYFDVAGFLADLSIDGAEVVKILFNYVPDLEMEILERDHIPNPDERVRYSLRQYLRDMKWSARRIRETFKELREAVAQL